VRTALTSPREGAVGPSPPQPREAATTSALRQSRTALRRIRRQDAFVHQTLVSVVGRYQRPMGRLSTILCNRSLSVVWPRLAEETVGRSETSFIGHRLAPGSDGCVIFRIAVDLNLRGKIAVVTGASKGIGLAITKKLVAESARVIAGARDVGGELGALASREAVRAVSIDLSAPDGPQTLVAHAEEFGGLDILVNNVGAIAVRLGGFASVTDDQWLSSLNLNFMAAVRTTRAALTPMLKRNSGVIVTISSVNSFLPDPGIIDYCASKAALTNFSKALSKEVGPKGIRMNTVSPGPVETALWLGPEGVAATVAKASGVDPETARKQVVASQGGLATGRFTRPDEVADLVLFLASDRSGNITGADFVIDGGLIKTL